MTSTSPNGDDTPAADGNGTAAVGGEETPAADAAGGEETPAAVLFGTGKDPRAAAERAVGPSLQTKFGNLPPLPAPIRKAAVGAVIAATVALLDFNMIELLVDGWREHGDLTHAARRTLAKPGTKELVALATHRITVSQQPSIDILLNGQVEATLHLALTLEFDVSAAVAEVSEGMMVALHSGRCDITATLTVEGADALDGHKRIELPGVMSLKRRIRLLREHDYERVRQARAAAEGEPAA